jgi:hypothetical protein
VSLTEQSEEKFDTFTLTENKETFEPFITYLTRKERSLLRQPDYKFIKQRKRNIIALLTKQIKKNNCKLHILKKCNDAYQYNVLMKNAPISDHINTMAHDKASNLALSMTSEQARMATKVMPSIQINTELCLVQPTQASRLDPSLIPNMNSNVDPIEDPITPSNMSSNTAPFKSSTSIRTKAKQNPSHKNFFNMLISIGKSVLLLLLTAMIVLSSYNENTESKYTSTQNQCPYAEKHHSLYFSTAQTKGHLYTSTSTISSFSSKSAVYCAKTDRTISRGVTCVTNCNNVRVKILSNYKKITKMNDVYCVPNCPKRANDKLRTNNVYCAHDKIKDAFKITRENDVYCATMCSKKVKNNTRLRNVYCAHDDIRASGVNCAHDDIRAAFISAKERRAIETKETKDSRASRAARVTNATRASRATRVTHETRALNKPRTTKITGNKSPNYLLGTISFILTLLLLRPHFFTKIKSKLTYRERRPLMKKAKNCPPTVFSTPDPLPKADSNSINYTSGPNLASTLLEEFNHQWNNIWQWAYAHIKTIKFQINQLQTFRKLRTLRKTRSYKKSDPDTKRESEISLVYYLHRDDIISYYRKIRLWVKTIWDRKSTFITNKTWVQRFPKKSLIIIKATITLLIKYTNDTVVLLLNISTTLLILTVKTIFKIPKIKIITKSKTVIKRHRSKNKPGYIMLTSNELPGNLLENWTRTITTEPMKRKTQDARKNQKKKLAIYRAKINTCPSKKKQTQTNKIAPLLLDLSTNNSAIIFTYPKTKWSVFLKQAEIDDAKQN